MDELKFRWAFNKKWRSQSIDIGMYCCAILNTYHDHDHDDIGINVHVQRWRGVIFQMLYLHKFTQPHFYEGVLSTITLYFNLTRWLKRSTYMLGIYPGPSGYVSGNNSRDFLNTTSQLFLWLSCNYANTIQSPTWITLYSNTNPSGFLHIHTRKVLLIHHDIRSFYINTSGMIKHDSSPPGLQFATPSNPRVLP